VYRMLLPRYAPKLPRDHATRKLPNWGLVTMPTGSVKKSCWLLSAVFTRKNSGKR